MYRATIRKAAPDASEKISYGIPTFYLNGNLVHFGVFTDHISFYPTSSGIAAFKKQLGLTRGRAVSERQAAAAVVGRSEARDCERRVAR